MRDINDISLSPAQRRALAELHHRLFRDFDVEALVLYGSVARGEADEESDLDLLVLTTQPLDRTARHEITDVVFEVNLEYGTNFRDGSLIRDGGQRYLWFWQTNCGEEIGGTEVVQVDFGPLHGVGALVGTACFDIEVFHQGNASEERLATFR